MEKQASEASHTGTPAAELQTATLGGGCFWCLEALFEQLVGVQAVVSGYAGGDLPNPTYAQVCSGSSGHAEVISVTFSPEQISYRDLLGLFFSSHDPTTLNRQGADVGTQYRSIILYHDEQQRQTAADLLAELAGANLWGNPIVTELAPFTGFYAAETYHQGYFRQNQDQPYCAMVVAPKVAKFRKQFSHLLKG